MAGLNTGYCSKEKRITLRCFLLRQAWILTVQESQLEPYQENFDETVKKKTKGVANAFSEVTTFPDIYLENLNLNRASLASVVDNAKKELENLRSGLRNEIERRVRDNLTTVPSTGLASSVTECQLNYCFSHVSLCSAMFSLLSFQPFFACDTLLFCFFSHLCSSLFFPFFYVCLCSLLISFCA